MIIRPAQTSDANYIAEIYNYYIQDTAITFEEQMVAISDMEDRIRAVHDFGLPWLVATQDSMLVGYAYATKWKERSAYRFSVESTVYLSHKQCGKGLGFALYKALFDQLKECDVKTVIGGITLPNPSSVGLHEKFGMKKVAHFKKVGFKFNQWHDVGYWQMTL